MIPGLLTPSVLYSIKTIDSLLQEADTVPMITTPTDAAQCTHCCCCHRLCQAVLCCPGCVGGRCPEEIWVALPGVPLGFTMHLCVRPPVLLMEVLAGRTRLVLLHRLRQEMRPLLLAEFVRAPTAFYEVFHYFKNCKYITFTHIDGSIYLLRCLLI